MVAYVPATDVTATAARPAATGRSLEEVGVGEVLNKHEGVRGASWG